MMKLFFSILAFSLTSTFFNLEAAGLTNFSWVKADHGHSQVRLISQLESVAQDEFEVLVGLEFKLETGWHTYWKNPGDVGYPPRLKWSLPHSWKASPIYYPTPEYFPAPPTDSGNIEADSYGYKDSVIYPAILQGGSLQDSHLNIQLQVDYLVCHEICIPETAQLELNLPIQEAAKRSSYFQKLENSFQSLPTKDSSIQAEWTSPKLLTVRSSLIQEDFSDDQLFIYEKNNNTKFWNIRSSSKGIAKLEFDKDVSSIELHLKSQNQSSRYILTKPSSVALAAGIDVFLISLLFAFLGGFILNLMPCVLPIIFLKTNSILQLRDKQRDLKRSLFMTIAGILTSFFILAAFILSLQQLGKQVGWGFQFQNPGFVSFMVFVIFLFSLNLFGVFEIQLPGFLNKKMSSSSSPFFEGVFATLLATPCSAPFLGTSLSFALQQPPLVLILFFMVMGIGFAAPYFAFALFPKTISLLPKPGNWMLTMKRVLAYSLMGTALWLLYVLNQQTISLFIFLILLSLLVFYVAIRELKLPARLLAIAAVFIFVLGSADHFSKSSSSTATQDYVNFSSETARGILENQPLIFVNITADWCLTCKYNEATVLHTQWFQDLLESKGIEFITVDWTQPSETTGRFLEENGRAGIPFSMFLSEGKKVLLPELLTRGIVEKRLSQFLD